MFAYAALVALIANTAFVRSEVTPNAPGPGDVFKQGGQCTFSWDPDTTGVWKQMNVELMSGNNWDMNHITTVATNIDGTDATKSSFSYNCPEVLPNSAIYFYQFSTSAAPSNLTWTTRFTIATSDGSIVPPTGQTQPDGQAIPWGVGALDDPSTAVAAPSYLASSDTSVSNAATASASSTTAAAPASSAPATTAAVPTTAQPLSTSSKLVTAPAAPSSSSSASSNTSATQQNSTAVADNGAASLLGYDSHVTRAGLALGLAAFTFAFAL